MWLKKRQGYDLKRDKMSTRKGLLCCLISDDKCSFKFKIKFKNL